MKRAFLLVTLFALFLGLSEIHAWVEPTLPPTGGNVTAPLRLDASGNLGIGVTTAGAKLDIARPGNANVYENGIRVNRPDAIGQYAFMGFGQSSSDAYFGSYYTGAAGSYGQIHFRQYSQGGLFRDALNIVSSGNVGIGNTAPGATLHVGSGGVPTIPSGTATTFTPQIINSQTSGVAGLSVGVIDGVNNRRIGLFSDQTNGIVGISSLYSSGAPAFVYRDGGGEKLRIDSTGRMGIGQAAPAGKLDINARANGSGYGLFVDTTTRTPGEEYVRFGDTTTADFMVNSTGNVGIGTAAPAYRLDVAGDVNVTGCVRVAGTCLGSSSVGTGTAGVLSKWVTGTTLGNSRLSEQVDGSVRTTSPTGWVDIGPKNAGFNHIYTDRPATIFNTGVWAISGIFSSYTPDNLRLQTNGTDRITALASNGNVGIGTNAPTQRLTVEGNVNKTGSWILSGNVNWGPNALEIYNSNWDGVSNNNYGTVAAGHVYSYNGLQSGGATGAEAGDGQLYVSGNSMLMGSVGIGKNNPSNTLDVAGGMNVTGSVDASSLAYINNTHPTGGVGLSATAQINGVYGYAQNSTGWGVRGVGGGANSTGVRGEGYYGVRGQAQNGPAYATYGVYGATEGIYGTGAYGVYCHATSPSSLCGGNKTWTNTSDLRLKKNISTVTNGLDKVLKLRGVNYQWKEGDTETKNIGFIAQEVLEVVPEVVSKGSDGYYVMRESSLSAVLVEAIKELKAENDDLKARLERLEAKLK